MRKLVLVRHGQSLWNLENKFTGWVDVDLSEKGIAEAKDAGQKLLKSGFDFKTAFVSKLTRANHTLKIILREMSLENIKVHRTYKLNERHYGALQGLNKDDAILSFGSKQVHLWRRSYDVRPPKKERI